jgi:HAE1 family hydrophobic/amphiphilic exporter-1
MSRFFIERPILANVIAIIIILLGAVCLYSLPVAQYPQIVPPTIQVSTTYAGANAETVANTVGIPIEQAVNGIESSIYMQSTSGSDGSFTLTVTFTVGTDLNTVLPLVQNAVNGAVPQLPQAVQAQGVNVRKVSTNILLIASLYSEDDRYDEAFLSNYAIINLQSPLQRLPGVGQVSVLGAGPYSMRIWLDPEKLRAFGLTVLDVQKAIQHQNVQVASGQLGGPPTPSSQPFQFTVNVLGRLADVQQFESIVIKSDAPSSRGAQGTPIRDAAQSARLVRIRDVARVELSQQVFTVFSRLSGRKTAHIGVYALPGANALQVGAETRALMAKMSASFPPGLRFVTLYDTTVFINQSISAVYQTLIEAGILVLIVIVLFLQNTRAMLVPATTVPVTIIGAFAAMALLGFTVNLMTLFALILAIGIVVDDAIVIVENTSRYIESGLTPKDAAIKAMRELTGPVLGITLVLTSVFLPASFLPGITGQMFRQFALVIAATAMISALNALTLKPAQCALYLRPRRADRRPNWFFRGFNRVYDAVEGRYVALIGRMVRHPFGMAGIFLAVVGLAVAAFAVYPTTLLPLEDQGYCILVAQLPSGASQPRAREVATSIDAMLGAASGIKGWVTIGGYSAIDAAKLSTVITTFVVFDDWGARPAGFTQASALAGLQARVKTIPAATFAVLPPSPIPGLGNAFGFQMMVEDRGGVGLAELQKAVQEILRRAHAMPDFLRIGFSTFSASSPQLHLDIDRTMAKSLGVTVNDVFETLQTSLGSTYVNLFNKFNQSFQVRVQAEADYRRRMADIGNLSVANRSGQMVPLGSLVAVRRTLGSELVTRYNLYPAATITGIPMPKFSSGQALRIMERLAHDTLPQRMRSEWTGLSYQEKLVGNQIYLVFALSITLVFLVLAAQYESWLDPAAVILTVPMALVGIVLALVVRRFPIDLYTQIGLVLMTALAAKNAILIVEFARELAAGGMPPADAALEATRRRFRPILMTSTAFILGVVPLLTATGAGAASQQALGTVVFGGMLASTLLAIPFVPVLYVVMQRIGERFARRRATAREIACAILVLGVLGATRGTALARSAHRLTHEPGVVDYWPRFLPDGRTVLFSRCEIPTGCGGASTSGYWTLWTTRIRHGTPARFLALQDVAATRSDILLERSAAREQIAFEGVNRGGADPSDLWIVGTDGAGLREVRLPPSVGTPSYPSWFPDGASVLLTGRRASEPGPHLVRVASDTGELIVTLTSPDVIWTGMSAASHDGRMLTVAAQLPLAGQEYDDTNNQIWLQAVGDPTTQDVGLHQLDALQGRAPDWSPNDRFIMFESSRGCADGRYAIFIEVASGGAAIQATDCRLNANHGVWAPDGKRFLFSYAFGDPTAGKCAGGGCRGIAIAPVPVKVRQLDTAR